MGGAGIVGFFLGRAFSTPQLVIRASRSLGGRSGRLSSLSSIPLGRFAAPCRAHARPATTRGRAGGGGTGQGAVCKGLVPYGARRACGVASSPPCSSRPMPRGTSIGTSIALRARPSGRTSMRPRQRGTRRPQRQGPSPQRVRGQAADTGAHARPAARGQRLRAAHGAGGYSSGKSRRYARRRGIRVTIPGGATNVGAGGSIGGSIGRGTGGAADQPMQAVPVPGHALRETGGELPGAIEHRRPPALALIGPARAGGQGQAGEPRSARRGPRS